MPLPHPPREAPRPSLPLSLPRLRLAIISACAALLASAAPATLRAAPTPEAGDRVQIREAVTEGFRHPGVGLTREMFENARAQVIAKRDPWYSAYAKMAAHPNSAESVSCRNQSTTDPTKPDSDTFDSRAMVARLAGDSDKAWRQALMFYFTGKETHRANAMNIIRVWSKLDPRQYRSFAEDHIHASYPIQNLIRAAELMRYTDSPKRELAWSDADTRAFVTNFVTPSVTTFLDRNGHFMNQAGYPMAAAMSGDIFTSDRKNYERRVEWFTVNKNAPNKGWSYSIRDLGRLVDTDAITGEKIAAPRVQLMEMGRDQAHAGGDVEIFMNIAGMMNAQRTRVDPRTGVVSTAPDAVGPYEFLDDRILAVADYFCRFMLGYDTPWTPVAYDIAPDGKVRAIYPRIADNYRGRLRGFDFWDAYFHYAVEQGVDLSKKAPYYHKAFAKRIVNSDTDWLRIPASVSGEPARVPATEQEPAAVEVELRSAWSGAAAAAMSDATASFVRVTPSEAGARVAFLSMDTGDKTVALRFRSNDVVILRMSGLAKPWLLPDTRGEWRTAAYTMGSFERFRDIVYFTVLGSPETRIDFDRLVRRDAKKLPSPAFRSGPDDVRLVAYVGAPITLDFAPADVAGDTTAADLGRPDGSTLDPKTGAFAWRPSREGEHEFFVTLTTGDLVATKRVQIIVAPDRQAAVRQIVAAHDLNTRYVTPTFAKCKALFDEIGALQASTGEQAFFAKLIALQDAFSGLKLLTPLLPDGSVDFPSIVESSDIGESIGLLTDGNDDTFPVHTLAMDFNYVFDFGAGFRFAPTAFAIEGRLNFEDRARATALFGSDDGKTWTRLTETLEKSPAELARLDVKPDLASKRFRYLKVEKSRSAGGLFEPSELRLHGQRHEAE